MSQCGSWLSDIGALDTEVPSSCGFGAGQIAGSARRYGFLKVHFGQWLDGFLPRLPVGEAVMGEAWAVSQECLPHSCRK